ncbi:MAG TPA: maleylpyruvate isomerase family mycothiol-dependent enzyme [Candidatus Dormibacteraeota bacterium]
MVSSAPFDFVTEIAEHSAGLADAAEGNLDADVVGCPGWTVADLVHHLTTTHWFWATIVEELLDQPPDESRRPPRAQRSQLIADCRLQAARLARVLRAADAGTAVYTWAPAQRDVAFVSRHQVQEAAIHHWDAVHARGGVLEIAAPVAADSIEEFLTFSVSSDRDPADPPRPAMAGALVLQCSDSERSWTVHDSETPGNVAFEPGAAPGSPAITASASDLLLWLYRRLPLDTGEVPEQLAARFRALCFTD